MLDLEVGSAGIEPATNRLFVLGFPNHGLPLILPAIFVCLYEQAILYYFPTPQGRFQGLKKYFSGEPI
jgi:nitroimidazol reductase NimA-like FMN-containing flavoprotein (pyridoxamine 5'-phosphate oxidase superfamily)